MIAFSLISVTTRLLEEREKRMQEALLMTGLNESVWYISWYFTFLLRSIILSVVGTLICSLFLFQKTPWYIVFISLLMYALTAAGYLEWGSASRPTSSG